MSKNWEMNELLNKITTPMNEIQYSHDGKTVVVFVILESPEAQEPFCLLPNWVKLDKTNSDVRGTLKFDGTNLQEKVSALKDCDTVEHSLRGYGVVVNNQLSAAIASGKKKGLL